MDRPINKYINYRASHDTLSQLPTVPQVIKPKGPYNKHYDIPIIIFASRMNERHCSILFSDLTKISSKSTVRYHCSPWNSKLPDCILDDSPIFPDELFSCHIHSNNIVGEETSSEHLHNLIENYTKDHNIVLARLQFDVRARSNKYLEGMGVSCKIVLASNKIRTLRIDHLASNVEDLMFGIENQFLKLLERMNERVSEPFKNRLITSLELGNFIERRCVSDRVIQDTQSSLYKDSQSFDVSRNETQFSENIIQSRNGQASSGLDNNRFRSRRNVSLTHTPPREDEETSDFDDFVTCSSQSKPQTDESGLSSLLTPASTTISQDIRSDSTTSKPTTPTKLRKITVSENRITRPLQPPPPKYHNKLTFNSVIDFKQYCKNHEVIESQNFELKNNISLAIYPLEPIVTEAIGRPIRLSPFQVRLRDSEGGKLILEFDEVSNQCTFLNLKAQEFMIEYDTFGRVEHGFKGIEIKNHSSIVISRKFRILNGIKVPYFTIVDI
ncbi:uncharacterized protein KGF55_002875 [Candida pseudojiufengensis]|uniref:uncharacterized protein n=1 Tax=Candida pseudojiufengensis TaxID=497109 RepID=UPI0022241E02|nr:uncharacterized protein KGF55_002875 [Candida pseudojiufengensis]KAI5963083.1 hypothetical protein KGF55_002875 [Candida pseudojiufengensis]